MSPTTTSSTVGAGVAEQAFVDVADLLDVDVAEGDPPGGLAPELGHLHRSQHLEHDPVADRDGERAPVVRAVRKGKRAGSNSEPP